MNRRAPGNRCHNLPMSLAGGLHEMHGNVSEGGVKETMSYVLNVN